MTDPARWPFDLPLDDRPMGARTINALFRSRNIIWKNDQKIVAGFGLSWTQFQTLAALRSSGGDHILSPTALYDATQVSSGGLTKALHALTEGGHVTRPPNPDDARSTLVKLTPKGAALVEEIVAQLIETNQTLIGAALSDTESAELIRLLERLLRHLQTLPKE